MSHVAWNSVNAPLRHSFCVLFSPYLIQCFGTYLLLMDDYRYLLSAVTPPTRNIQYEK